MPLEAGDRLSKLCCQACTLRLGAPEQLEREAGDRLRVVVPSRECHMDRAMRLCRAATPCRPLGACRAMGMLSSQSSSMVLSTSASTCRPDRLAGYSAPRKACFVCVPQLGLRQDALTLCAACMTMLRDKHNTTSQGMLLKLGSSVCGLPLTRWLQLHCWAARIALQHEFIPMRATADT